MSIISSIDELMVIKIPSFHIYKSATIKDYIAISMQCNSRTIARMPVLEIPLHFHKSPSQPMI